MVKGPIKGPRVMRTTDLFGQVKTKRMPEHEVFRKRITTKLSERMNTLIVQFSILCGRPVNGMAQIESFELLNITRSSNKLTAKLRIKANSINPQLVPNEKVGQVFEEKLGRLFPDYQINLLAARREQASIYYEIDLEIIAAIES